MVSELGVAAKGTRRVLIAERFSRNERVDPRSGSKMIMLANFVDLENRKAENVHRPGGRITSSTNQESSKMRPCSAARCRAFAGGRTKPRWAGRRADRRVGEGFSSRHTPYFCKTGFL